MKTSTFAMTLLGTLLGLASSASANCVTVTDYRTGSNHLVYDNSSNTVQLRQLQNSALSGILSKGCDRGIFRRSDQSSLSTQKVPYLFAVLPEARGLVEPCRSLFAHGGLAKFGISP